MSDRVPIPTPLIGPLRDRAVDAWRQVHTGRVPLEGAEVLQIRSKSVIVRFGGDGGGSAMIAKRCPTKTALVEHGIYTKLLADDLLPALRCYGMVPEPEGDLCWLFLEDAGGAAYSAALPEHRALAGRWLATLHRSVVSAELRELLPERGASHYLPQLHSAQDALDAWSRSSVLRPEDADLLRTIASRCLVVQEHWSELATFCDQSPRTLVHGDLAQKNLRVRTSVGGLALLAYDWEMAGWGAPAVDLAQFIGKCASPDLDVYGSVLREGHRGLDVGDIRKLADYGALLRILDKVYWETLCLVGDSYRYLSKPVLTLRLYDAQLAAALRAVHWDPHD